MVNAVPAPGSPANTLCAGEGLLRCNAGEEGRFTVDVRDAFGNRAARGTYELRITLLGPKIAENGPRKGERDEAVVERDQRLDNGVWECRYTVTKSGPYILKVICPSG
eukprot:6581514-Pyramimonas_sp.AAC.1